MDNASPAVLLTGTSKGIGGILMSLLCARGYHVISVGRHAPNDTPIIGGQVTHINADLSASSYVEELADWLADRGNAFNFVGFIHCAGVGSLTPILETSTQLISEQISVNLLSGILISKLILPYLNRQESRVCFVGSRARRFPFLGGSAYCASKAGIHALADCLALEVKELGWNIGVSIFEFGRIATGFAGVQQSSHQISAQGAADLILDVFLRQLTTMI